MYRIKFLITFSDWEKSIPGHWAGDTTGCPPEGSGREGRSWGSGVLVGIASDRGNECLHAIFEEPLKNHVSSVSPDYPLCQLSPPTESNEFLG